MGPVGGEVRGVCGRLVPLVTAGLKQNACERLSHEVRIRTLLYVIV